MIKCVIIAAGEATRWNNYLGVPKHLIEIDGETLIQRTVRLLHKYKKQDIQVSIMVKDPNDKRYCVEGATTKRANLDVSNLDSDKFISSMHEWNLHGRTLVIYGDVWFSEECVKTIMDHETREWVLFGNKSECFVQSFYYEHIPKHLHSLLKVRDMHVNGLLIRCGGWEHYRAMCGYPVGFHKIGKHFFSIDDSTDDFDFPSDYDEWIKKHNKK